MIETSDGSLLSSPHGAFRREHRNISKLDLQSVKKYGSRVRTFGHNHKPRWKFTFADVVYITEDDEVTEVTSYVLPLKLTKAAVTSHDGAMHEALVRKLQTHPSIATSHTVIIIDQSASMRTCDVDNYKTRSDAVYASVAVDYIGEQIDNRNRSNVQYTDVVTLIEMNETSQIVFQREPCTNVLYNKLLHRRETARPNGHGVYRAAMDLALNVFLKDLHDSMCPLLLMLYSDGRPSDFMNDPEYNAATQISELCGIFKDRLTVVTLGFAKSGSDFSILEQMAASATSSGSQGFFKAVNLRGDDLFTTIANLSLTMSQTRQMCSVVQNVSKKRTVRSVIAEPKLPADYAFDADKDNVTSDNWDIYRVRCNKLAWRENWLTPVDHVEGVAICRSKLGEGAERMVFRLKELVLRDGKLKVSGKRLVAKECKFIEDLDRQSQFHEAFCKTQSDAFKLATAFNAKVERVCRLTNIPVAAIIKFLRSYVYEIPLPESDSHRYVLVEKRLDTSKYVKWNSNIGFVRGHRTVAEVLSQQENKVRAVLKRPEMAERLDAIVEEEDEEYECEDCKEDLFKQDEELIQQQNLTASSATTCYNIRLEDFPQAFSHFTYRYSQRRKLVCDLQGVLDISTAPAVFELTDPVIHYKSSDYLKQAFGRSDLGMHGINKFFETHRCSDLCQLLGLRGYL